MDNKKSKTAFVLEGGAMRGLYSAGILDVFLKNNIKTDAIYGVSAGALFGINYKSRQLGRPLRYNLKYVHEKNYMGLYSLITTGNIMNKKFCFEDLIYELDRFDFETYTNNPIDFYAVVSNLESGKAEYINLNDIKTNLEYLRASGSMPFVSKNVVIDGKNYLDGAICDAIPIEKVINEGYGKIVVILTRPENYNKKSIYMPFNLVYNKFPNFVETANNSPKKYNETLDLIKKYEEEKKIFVFRPSEIVKMHRVEKDKKKLQQIYDLGAKDATNCLDQLEQYLNQPIQVL